MSAHLIYDKFFTASISPLTLCVNAICQSDGFRLSLHVYASKDLDTKLIMVNVTWQTWSFPIKKSAEALF